MGGYVMRDESLCYEKGSSGKGMLYGIGRDLRGCIMSGVL